MLLVVAIAFPTSAAVIKNVELKGEIQTIASDVKYSKNNMFAHGAKTRAIAGFSFDVAEVVKANLLFQYVYAWGDHNYTNNGFDNAKGMKLANANLVFSNLFDALEVTIGRQFYGEDDSTIIYFGPGHYTVENDLYARALDGVKFAYSDDIKSITLLAGKVADVTNGYVEGIVPNVRLVSNVFGGDAKLRVTDNFTAQAYLYDFADGTLTDGFYSVSASEYYGVEWEHVGVWGSKLALDTETFRMSAEYARNFAGKRLIKEHGSGHAGYEGISEIGTGYLVKADLSVDAQTVTTRGSFVYVKEGFISQGNYSPGLLMGRNWNLLSGLFWYSAEGGYACSMLGLITGQLTSGRYL